MVPTTETLAPAPVPVPAAPPAPRRPSGAEKRKRRAVRAAVAADQAATWPAVYLAQYAVHGNLKLAAATAGVEPKEVRARIKQDADFAEQVWAAHEDFCDNLEHALVVLGINKNNALALLARLKAERPQKYQDELRINASLKSVVLHAVAPEAAVELLRLMVADATPATLASLSPGRASEGQAALPASQKGDTGPAVLDGYLSLDPAPAAPEPLNNTP